ncbi:hypothetical protein LCGC14_2784590 [marine sediment metagenome]|uniref:Uncharacterized protein n=1 Tax=marine sediment metagenome TaxID=412755 RepID=A0A0F9BIR9_9ZZZZ
MPNIFLVTEGEYSDYRVLAAFTTAEAADAFATLHTERSQHSDRPQVEECPLDAPQEEWLVTYVRMAQDGRTLDTWVKVEAEIVRCWLFDVHDNLVWPVVTDGLERAVKVTNEKRAMLLAADAWGRAKTDAAYAALGIRHE